MLDCRLPGLFENLFRPPTSGIGLQIYINIYNSIWLFVFACVAYGVVRLLAACHALVGIHFANTQQITSTCCSASESCQLGLDYVACCLGCLTMRMWGKEIG